MSLTWRRVVLVGLCGLAFVNAWPDEFVLDAKPIIVEHPQLEPGGDFLSLWTSTYWGHYSGGELYRPLTMASFYVERAVLGFSSAWPHALVNLLLHAAAVLAIETWVRRLTGRPTAGLVAAALFAVHPAASEIVPNLVGRADLLATLGVMLGLLAWERREGAATHMGPTDESRVWVWTALCLICWVAGLLAKESAIVLPGLIVVVDAWRSGWRGVLRGRLRLYTAFAIIGAAYLAVRWSVIAAGPPGMLSPMDNPLVDQPLSVRVLTSVVIWAGYVKVCVWPIELASDYSPLAFMPVTSPSDPRLWVSVVVVASTLALLVLLWRRRNVAAVGLALFFVSLLPVANTLLLIGTIFAVRLVYLPLIGLCLSAGVAGAWLWDKARIDRRRMGVAAAGLVVLIGALSFRTWQRNEAWRSNFALWRQAAQDVPRSWRPHINLAGLYGRDRTDMNQLRLALHHTRQAYEVARHFAPQYRTGALVNLGGLHLNRAITLQERGAPGDQVRSELLQAVQLVTRARQIMNDPSAKNPERERLLAWRREHGLPVEHLLETRQAAAANLGMTLYRLGRYRDAIEPLREAVQIHPTNADLWSLFGRSLGNARQLEAAEAALARAVQLEPEDDRHQRFLARVLLQLGRLDDAADYARRAVALRDAPANRSLLAEIEAAQRAGDAMNEAAPEP